VRPLLLRFADPTERCRELAIQLLAKWAGSAEPSELAGVLPFLMPVMVERMGCDTMVEPSEEVRALLATLMKDILVRCRKLLQPYLAEFGAVALGCCRDSNPTVLKATSELLHLAAVQVLQPVCKQPDGGRRIKPFSTKLLEALLPHIRHRHSSVRLEVLKALQELLLCGAGQSVETLVGWRLKNNVPIAEFYGKGTPRINYLADLSRDRSVAVRRQLVVTAGQWCRRMAGEDLYEQEVRILPYLLSGLFDVDDDIRRFAHDEMEELGKLHAEMNEKDYKEKIEYSTAHEAAADAAYTIPLPAPFTRRPSIGARGRVRDHFRAHIYPIMAELEQWTAPERLQSAKLLEVLLVYEEQYVTEFAHQLLPALAKAADSTEPKGLAEKVGDCAALFAQHAVAGSYLPLLHSKVTHDPLNTLTQRHQYVLLLPSLLRGMRLPALVEALPVVFSLLEEEELIASQHFALRRSVNALLQTLPSALARDEALHAQYDAALQLAVQRFSESDPSQQPAARSFLSSDPDGMKRSEQETPTEQSGEPTEQSGDPPLEPDDYDFSPPQHGGRTIEIEEEDESSDEEGVVVVVSPKKQPPCKDELDDFEDEMD